MFNIIIIGLVVLGIIIIIQWGQKTIPSWIEHEIAQSVQQGINVHYNEVAKKIELQGQKLDSMGTALAATHYLMDPNFFNKLFSQAARDQAKFRDSILNLIPLSVSNEFRKAGLNVAEVGTTILVVDSVLIEVKVGNSVKFTRGYLTYNPQGNKYTLGLYKDSIEIVEVRSKPQDDGRLLSTVTARSKLTGQQFQATSDRYLLDWEQSPWDYHPYIVGGTGITLPYDQTGFKGYGYFGGDWLKYTGREINWNAIQLRATPEGLHVTTGLSYKLF